MIDQPTPCNHSFNIVAWRHHERIGAHCSKCGELKFDEVAAPLAVPGSAQLTIDDIETIVEGIEQFIVSGDNDVADIWQPYIDKLNALKHTLALSGTGEPRQPEPLSVFPACLPHGVEDCPICIRAAFEQLGQSTRWDPWGRTRSTSHGRRQAEVRVAGRDAGGQRGTGCDVRAWGERVQHVGVGGNMKKTAKDRCAAVVTIKDASKWTKRGRREVADWLRRQAQCVEASGEAYTGTCRMRYLY